MRDLKIVQMGAGSVSWAPHLLANIFGAAPLASSTLVLFDVNPEALARTQRLAERFKAESGHALRIEATTERKRALAEADFVIVTIAPGGLAAMAADLGVAERYGIRMTVGDTTGPCGLSRALRSVPVFLELARDMERLCPQAWMLNASNPLAPLTRVVNKETSIRALGLCHGVRNRIRLWAAFFGCPLAQLHFVNTGIDHCSWLTSFCVAGRPAEEILWERGVERWLRLPPEEARQDPVFGPIYEFRCGLLLWPLVGALPAMSDRHLTEFFPWFQRGDGIERYGLTRTSVAEREAHNEQARARIERMIVGEEPLPPLSEKQAQDNVAGWMIALSGEQTIEDNLNAPNVGQIPQLPAGAIVETRGWLDGTGAHPFTSPLTPALEAILRPQVLREEMIVEAALAGDRQKALAALALDPLAPDLAETEALLQELLMATRAWLPQFF